MKTLPKRQTIAFAFRLASIAVLLTFHGHAQVQYQLLKSFTGADGSGPMSGLLEASDGALYGVTPQSGTNGGGTIYRIQKDGSGYTVLHHFSTNSFGAPRFPSGRLIEASDGMLYGTTPEGGTNCVRFIFGVYCEFGTVFRINKDGTGFEVVHHFDWGASSPQCGLLEGSDGMLYGLGGDGGVFKLKKDGSQFSGDDACIAALPETELIEGSDGLIYGAGPTACGGSECAPSGHVYRFSKDLRILNEIRFTECSPRVPTGSLLEASDGHLYGACDAFEGAWYQAVYSLFEIFFDNPTRSSLGYTNPSFRPCPGSPAGSS